MKIKHVTLRVKNLEKSIQFYETITELVISSRFQSGPAELAFMSNGTGETEIELVYIPQGQTFEGKGMFICFETDKLDEMHALAQEAGFNPSAIQVLVGQARHFYVSDPDGVSVQLRLLQSVN